MKTDWDGLQPGLSTGKFDANHTLLMYLLQGVEKDLHVKITGGVHTGCLRIQAGAKTDIKTVEDLKGKTIGVPAPSAARRTCSPSASWPPTASTPRNDSKDVHWKAIQGGRWSWP